MKQEWKEELSEPLEIAQRYQRLTLGMDYEFGVVVFPMLGIVVAHIGQKSINYMIGLDDVNDFEENIKSHLKKLNAL